MLMKVEVLVVVTMEWRLVVVTMVKELADPVRMLEY